MADYSIGVWVEVRWQVKPFNASVIHVHSSGKVDVVYDIDGSVGTFLNSARSWRQTLLGRRLLTKNGTGLCPKHGAISMRGKCKKHDSRTVACSAEGCSTTAIARRVCSKHGALGTCSFNKCTSAVDGS